MTNIWLDRIAAKKIAFWSVIYLAIIWLMAPFLYRPDIQPYGNEWVLRGHGLASIAIWGYSLLILLLGNVDRVVMFQSIMGAIAIASLMVRLNYLVPRSKTITTTIFLFALPWLSYMSYAYQLPMSSVFMIFTLLAMEITILSGKISWGIIAGVLAGIGQNFRSELVILPAVILAVLTISRRFNWFRCSSLKPLVVSVGIAFLLQLPWAFNCYFNAGRFSLSESNLGHTLFIDLGYLPSNPWNIVPTDAFGQETVDKAGLNFSSLSFKGSDFLLGKFVDNISQHPSAYINCLGVRAWETIIHPFSSLPLVSTTPRMESIHKIFSRDRNVGLNHEPEEKYATSKIKIAVMWFYYIINGFLNRIISILGIIGFFLAMRVGPFKLTQPLIFCLSIVVFYRCGLNIAIGAAGKYMTGVYLCYLPFVINTIWFVYDRWVRSRLA